MTLQLIYRLQIMKTHFLHMLTIYKQINYIREIFRTARSYYERGKIQIFLILYYFSRDSIVSRTTFRIVIPPRTFPRAHEGVNKDAN